MCILVLIILYLLLRQYEKKRNEAKQFGIYSDFLIKGIEKERERISKDIHDTVLQDIKSLTFKYEMIDTNNVEANKLLKKDLLNHTDSCIKKLRIICQNLTPVEFKHVENDMNGFFLALKNLTDQFMEQTNIKCILKIQNSIDLPPVSMETRMNIFRIIQEALNNVEKHSKATLVSIILSITDNSNNIKTMKIFITDNGIGFDLHSKNREYIFSGKHFGISNMKERARQIGGNIQIISEENEGTEIKLEVPLK